MNLHNLKPAQGSANKTKKRLGRGQGSGHGGTASRGHKGAKSRSGYKSKVGFEGGQMPLQRRVPKVGFKNPGRIVFRGINLDTLQQLAEQHKETVVNKEVLINHGLASKNDIIKILGRGELSAKLEVSAEAFSKAAVEAIEKSGGKAVVVNPKATQKLKLVKFQKHTKTNGTSNAAPKAAAKTKKKEEKVLAEKPE
ncbi:MAG: 50S ribosomal protein L15 [Flavobacteriales bacterium]|nr:50S ribosomal protein L15 [Flavobacteriales bacterium]MCB9447082.1 50S ribosomal protein L15 [Flavobacteriales bacterium]